MTGIYTIAGGLAAAIYTELVQTLVLLTDTCADVHRLERNGRIC
jgi:hypothetical protein